MACTAGHKEIASILIEHGAVINPGKENSSRSPLHETALRGKLDNSDNHTHNSTYVMQVI